MEQGKIFPQALELGRAEAVTFFLVSHLGAGAQHFFSRDIPWNSDLEWVSTTGDAGTSSAGFTSSATAVPKTTS